MLPELALASKNNQAITFAGKLVAGLIFPFAIDFPITLLLIALWAQIPVINTLPMVAVSAIFIILLGNAVGMVPGAILPEIVVAVPSAIFLVLASLFLCGGFQDLRTMPLGYQQVVAFIPFTYCFSLTKNAMLGTGVWDWGQFAGLCINTILLGMVGMVVYRKRVIRS